MSAAWASLQLGWLLLRYRVRVRRHPFIRRLVTHRLERRAYLRLLQCIAQYLKATATDHHLVRERLTEAQEALRQYFTEHEQHERALAALLDHDLTELGGGIRADASAPAVPELPLIVSYTSYVKAALPVVCAFADGVVAKTLMVDYASDIVRAASSRPSPCPSRFFQELQRTEPADLHKVTVLFSTLVRETPGAGGTFLSTVRTLFDFYLLLLNRLEQLAQAPAAR